MTTKSVSDRLVTLVVLAFALWTLCCQLVVALGGNLYELLTVFTVSTVAVLGLARKFHQSPTPPSQVACPQSTVKTPESKAIRYLRLAGALAAVLGVPILHHLGHMHLLWWWIAGWLLVPFVAFFFGEDPVPESATAESRLRAVALWSLAIGMVIFTLFARRTDYDDSIYVNFAIAVADYPGEAIFAKDTLHGIEGLPLSLSIYRLQAWELLVGAFAWLTGIPAIYAFHWVAASLAALLLPLALARLFRLLAPRVWLEAVVALVIVLIAAGETHRWYGNFSFVRIWQGKSLLVSILLPLIAVAALEYMAKPSRRRWIFLGAAQVAAVGVNVTALWAAPAVALSALVCGMRPTWTSLRQAALGASASGYILIAGALAKKEVSTFVVPDDAPFDFGETGDLLIQSLGEVLGNEHLLLFGLVALPLAWTLAPRGLGRRYATGLPLAVWLILLNPYLVPLVFKQVTGPAYWRLLWSLPIPVLMTLVLIAPLRLKGRRGLTLSLACLVAYSVFIPAFSGFSRKNRVLMDSRLMLKVRLPMYRLAKALHAEVGPGAYVLAPNEISMWITTMHHHAYPLKARHYLNLNRFYLGEKDFEYRGRLMKYVAGQVTPGDAESFRLGLEHFSITGVCLRKSKFADEARLILRDARFLKKGGDARHELWIFDESLIHADGFERGDLSGWSAQFPGAED